MNTIERYEQNDHPSIAIYMYLVVVISLFFAGGRMDFTLRSLDRSVAIHDLRYSIVCVCQQTLVFHFYFAQALFGFG